MIRLRKKEAAPCSLDGAAAASIKLVQNYILTQFILQTLEYGLQVLQHLQGIRPDKVYTIADLCQCAFEDRLASAGVVKEAWHALGVVLDNEFRRIAVGDLDATTT
jgi:hypothetical protein